MQIRVVALVPVLLGVVSLSPLLAQNQSKQQQQQAKRQLQALEKSEEEAARRQELLEEVQPHADRFAEAMAARTYPDTLVQSYLSSLGQSLVPPQAPASTTFSFRVIQGLSPNAHALPDGRIYVTTGMLAHVENEAQLAMVLGHEIGHVIEEHTIESLRRRRSGQRRNKVVGAAAGAALGGLLGGKKGGGSGAAQGIAVGAVVGTLAATLANSVIRSKYSREQEEAADRIGTKLALERGFDPVEAARFWDLQHDRFAQRSFTTRVEHSLFGSHPRDRVRAENVRALIAGPLKPAIDAKQSGDGLTKGTPRFSIVMSGLVRDTGTLMAERSDRLDLAIALLERARQHRPNDPRLLWALGRTYRMVARSDDELAEADSLLTSAAEQDKREIYPAIHRDIAYAIASQSDDHATAAKHLQRYVTGHIAKHGKLPSDIDDVYDKMVLFGDNEWVPAVASGADSKPTLQAVRSGRLHPTVWHTPTDLEAFDTALESSSQQIERSFGGVLAGSN